MQATNSKRKHSHTLSCTKNLLSPHGLSGLASIGPPKPKQELLHSLSNPTSLLLTLHGFTLSFALQPTWELCQTLLQHPMSLTWNVTSQTLPIPSLSHHDSSPPSPLTSLTWIPPLSISVPNLLSQLLNCDCPNQHMNSCYLTLM